MDVLHVSVRDIDEIPASEMGNYLHYCWTAYNQRRMDDPNAGEKGGKKHDWSNLNPVAQNLKKKPQIPQKFLKAIQDNEL